MMFPRGFYSILFGAGVAMTAIVGCSVDADVETGSVSLTESEMEVAQDPGAIDGPENLSVLDPIQNRPFEVAHWAPGDDDRRQLVVVSHGFAGDATSHAPLAEGLARNGYTVAAPTHPDLAGLKSAEFDLDPLVLRPRHISLTIDHIEAATGPFESVTILGHSLGGYTSLRLLGANPSGTGMDSYCDEHSGDVVLCTPGARTRFEHLAAEQPLDADPRIDRAILLAPAYGPLFSAEDLADVAVPVLVIEADSDQELPGDQVQELADHLPATTEYVSVPGGHYIFLRSCTAEETTILPELCTDPGDSDRVATAEDLVASIDDFANRS